jgi:hypothetical protein
MSLIFASERTRVICSPAHWDGVLATMTPTAKMWVPSLSRSNIGPPLSPMRGHGAAPFLLIFISLQTLWLFVPVVSNSVKQPLTSSTWLSKMAAEGHGSEVTALPTMGVKKPLTAQVLLLLLIHTTPSTDLPDDMLIS